MLPSETIRRQRQRGATSQGFEAEKAVPGTDIEHVAPGKIERSEEGRCLKREEFRSLRS
jgi:hypothetical protein